MNSLLHIHIHSRTLIDITFDQFFSYSIGVQCAYEQNWLNKDFYVFKNENKRSYCFPSKNILYKTNHENARPSITQSW